MNRPLSAESVNVVELRLIQQRKMVLLKGIELFNLTPHKGILYFFENGLLGSNVSKSVFTKTGAKKKGTNGNGRGALQQTLGDTLSSVEALIGDDLVDRIVDILFFSPSLNKSKIGYYLGEPHALNGRVRRRYVQRRYKFGGLTLDAAMRLFFEDFRLPVETQQGTKCAVMKQAWSFC